MYVPQHLLDTTSIRPDQAYINMVCLLLRQPIRQEWSESLRVFDPGDLCETPTAVSGDKAQAGKPCSPSDDFVNICHWKGRVRVILRYTPVISMAGNYWFKA